MGPSHFEMSAVAKLVLERMGSMMTIPMAQESTQVVKQTKQIRLFQMEIQNIQSSNLPTFNPTKMEVFLLDLWSWTPRYRRSTAQAPRPWFVVRDPNRKDPKKYPFQSIDGSNFVHKDSFDIRVAIRHAGTRGHSEPTSDEFAPGYAPGAFCEGRFS